MLMGTKFLQFDIELLRELALLHNRQGQEVGIEIEIESPYYIEEKIVLLLIEELVFMM